MSNQPRKKSPPFATRLTRGNRPLKSLALKALALASLILGNAPFVATPAFATQSTATQGATQAVATEHAPIVLPNPSFEEVDPDGTPNGWHGSKAVFSRSTDFARTGSASFCWENRDSKSYLLSSANIQGLIPGKYYLVSGWIKTQNVSGGKATICVEWNGPDKKWLGGSYLQGLNGTKDWTRVHQIFEFPENAQDPHISCYGTRDAVGKAWFDDLEIVPYVFPCITAMTTDKYRAQAVGGNVRLYVGLSFSEKEFSPPLQQKITLEIADAATGKTLRSIANFTWANDLSTKDSVVKKVRIDGAPKTENPPKSHLDDYLVFNFNADDLPTGKYLLTVKIPNPEKKENPIETASINFAKLEKLPKRKSYFDDRQRFILDGNPYFPLGLYFHTPRPEDVQRLKDSPFNCIMSYSRMDRETLDLLHDAGVASIYSVKDLYEGLHCSNDEEGRKLTTEYVNRLKDHPAIIAWYINDELPLSMLDDLAAHRDLVEELDPSRPAWVVLYQIDQIRQYLSTFDVVGTDPYPIPNQPASLAYDWSRKTHEACFGVRPTWQVPQIFNWKNYRDNGRNPTFEEMRSMFWMNLVGGGNGIIAYSYFDLERNLFGRDACPEEKKRSFNDSWEQVVKIAAEIKKYEDVFLSIEDPVEITAKADSSPKILTRLYALNGDTWLMAVNSDSVENASTFVLPPGMRVKNAEDWPGIQILQKDREVVVKFNALTPAFLQIGR